MSCHVDSYLNIICILLYTYTYAKQRHWLQTPGVDELILDTCINLHHPSALDLYVIANYLDIEM